MPRITHQQIMTSRFKCDDGIWRGVLQYNEKKGSYLMVIAGRFVEIKDVSWFEKRKNEVKMEEKKDGK